MRYWKRINPDGSTRTVESYSHNLDVKGAVEITEQEYNDFVASIPVPEPEPPNSIHLAKITGFDVTAIKPLSVVRTWQGNDYPYDCFASQNLKDEYVAGNVAIGDYVLVHFDDEGRVLAIIKVFKTW